MAVGKALQQVDPEKKEQIVSNLKVDFKKAQAKHVGGQFGIKEQRTEENAFL